MANIRSASEPYAALLARTVRERHGASWGVAETGAAGPSGNRYGDAAGHACLAVDGPTSRVLTLATGSADRRGNMQAFAQRALETLPQSWRADPGLAKSARRSRARLGRHRGAGAKPAFFLWGGSGCQPNTASMKRSR